MAGFQNVVAALRRTEAELEQKLESVRSAIGSLADGAKRGRPAGKRGPGRPKGSGKKKRKPMSAEGRAKIAAAQKKRWAEKKAAKK